MPTYDYRCKACGHELEIFQSMSEKPKRACPKCGKQALERQIGTGAAILFKGSGFYQTDYRSDSYKKSAESDAKPPAKDGGDAKPGEAAKPADKKPGDTNKPSADAPSKPAPAESKPRRRGSSRSKS